MMLADDKQQTLRKKVSCQCQKSLIVELARTCGNVVLASRMADIRCSLPGSALGQGPESANQYNWLR